MLSQAEVMTDPDPSPSLGDLIADCRVRRRMSRPQLALMVGASLSSIKNWEADRTSPSSVHLAALEHALGVRFVDDGTGNFQALDVDPAPEPAPAPQVVVVVAGTAEAMDRALDRLGVPRGE